MAELLLGVFMRKGWFGRDSVSTQDQAGWAVNADLVYSGAADCALHTFIPVAISAFGAPAGRAQAVHLHS
ncbi:MAG TPA: hypothetical protein VED86_04785 [archaeon]|nr:hypothetical protein [archaeon]